MRVAVLSSDTDHSEVTTVRAKATLLGGFWAQLASGATLAVAGPLLAVHLRRERAARREHPTRGLGRPSASASTFPASAGGAEGAAT